jgi:uncharacterized membrane protein YuzA (DUF378 family)
MASLKRLREPAAFVVLGVLVLQLLIELIEFFVYGSNLYGSLSAAALAISAQVTETVTLVILGLLVASCVLGDRTRHARLLVLLALIGSALMIAAALTLGLLGLAAASPVKPLHLVDLLLGSVLPTLVLIGLVTLWRLQPASDPEAAELPAVADRTEAGPEKPALPSTQSEPVWQPDAASGVAWHTAGDAAIGAPAAGWGLPGEVGGWEPIADDDDGSDKPRPTGKS